MAEARRSDWRIPQGRTWWLGASLGAVVLSLALRWPFLDAPLTADEGGYGETARLWAHGRALYNSVWVDRPQGLILAFRGALAVGLSSTVALRSVAVFAAALLALEAMVLARHWGGHSAARVAGLLVACIAASPFIEGFTLSGELLASVVTAAAMVVLLRFEEHQRLPVIAAAGLVAGAALTIKQSAFDAVLAGAVYLVITRRSRALAPLIVFVAAAAVPLALAAALSGDPSRWAQAIIGYGAHASLVTGSLSSRATLLFASMPAAGKALGPVLVLAALRWRRAPLLPRLWLLASLAGVGIGGGYHPHYYLQLVVPCALLVALGARASGMLPVVAAAIVAVGFSLPLWTATDSRQAEAIWPHDPHLQTDGSVAAYVRLHTSPSQPVYVMWAAADIYYLADRAPAYRYLWLRNLTTTRGGVTGVDELLAQRIPALVVEAQRPAVADPSGRTASLLRLDYRIVARVRGVRIWKPRHR